MGAINIDQNTVDQPAGVRRPHQLSLDLLRALAILLVLGRHSFSAGFWHNIGWSGVDLFFVISGFLVSGLIFEEYTRTGDVRIGRFLARRALKIYPSFYLFLSVSLIAAGLVGKEYTPSQILSEVFYLQSYIEGMWMHTWSLSVEEHFYLILAFVVVFWRRRGSSIDYRRTMGLLLGISLVLVLNRIYYCWGHRSESSFDFTGTHLRADGIWVGVILSYGYHFGQIKRWIQSHPRLLWVPVVGMMLTLWLYPAGSFAMNTLGFSIIALGFGCVLCKGLAAEFRLQLLREQGWVLRGVIDGLSAIGRHSYSIYLWHLLADNVLMKAGLFERLGLIYGRTAAGLITVVFSIVLGIIMAQMIENPILRWRNRVIA